MNSALAGILCVLLVAAVGCSKSKPATAAATPAVAPPAQPQALPLPVMQPVVTPQLGPPTETAAATRYTIRPLRELNHHSYVTSSLDFSPNGRMIATGCQRDGDIALWNWPEGTLHKVVEIAGAGGISQLCFSEDSQLLAYGTLAKTYGVIEVPSGKQVARHDDGHFRYYDGLTWSADCRFVYAVATYALEAEIHRLSMKSGESQVIVPKFERGHISFSPLQGTPLMISQTSVHGERMGLFPLGDSIDLTSPRQSFVVPSTMTAPYNITICADGSRFAFREGLSRRVDVFQVIDNKHVGGFSVTEDQLGSFQFLPGSSTKLIAYSGNNTWRYSSIAVRDITQPDRIRRLEVHAPTSVSGLSFSRDGKLLALGLFDGAAGIWEVAAIENAAEK